MPTYYYYTTVTYTTSAAHGLSVGSIVTVTGDSYAPFNVTNARVTAIPSSTTFKIAFTSSTLQSGTGGSVTPQGPSLIRTKGTVTATTSAAHNFQVGWTVQIAGFSSVAVGGASTAQYSNGIVTVTTTTAHGLPVDANVILSGASDASYNTPNGVLVLSVPTPTTFTLSYTPLSASATGITVSVPWNGNYTIASVPSTTTFTYADIGPDGSVSSSGTATIVGNITGGTHQVSLVFETRNGYMTKPSPPVTFTANGGYLMQLNNILCGPPDVVSRIVIMTPVITPPATTGSFYHVSIMVIQDNTTTSAIMDVSDSNLLAGTLDDPLFLRQILAESSGCIGYADRMFWWGTKNRIQNFLNMGFDGGYLVPSGSLSVTSGSATTTPTSGTLLELETGWAGASILINGTAYTVLSVGGGNITLTSTFVGTGGTYAATLYSEIGTLPPGWTTTLTGGATGSLAASLIGLGFSFTGSVGTTGDSVALTQNAYQDIFGASIVQPNTNYTVRFLGSETGAVVSIQCKLSSASTGFATAQTTNISGTTAAWYEVPLTLPTPNSIPSDLILSLQVNYNGASITFTLDEVSVFPTNVPVTSSSLVASFADDPEAFDGVTGLVTVSPSDGESIRACFQILDSKLYIVKERSLYWTEDDGTNEPSLWTVTPVSSRVGTPSIHGVGVGEGWAIIAAQEGAFIFWGGQPEKISQEIQPDWNTINWQYGHRIYTVVDLVNKRVHIGAPTGSNQWPNVEFVLDYRGLQSGAEIASAWSVHYSAYTNKILTIGDARKWTIWNVSANSAELVNRADGTQHLFRGNGAGNGKVYDQLTSQLSDDGAWINSYYTTYYGPSHQEEEQMRLSSDNHLFGYLKARITGAGFVTVSTETLDGTTKVLRYLQPPSNPVYDSEYLVNVTAPRLAYKVQASTVGSWFQLTKLIPFVQQSPTMSFRGT